MRPRSITAVVISALLLVSGTAMAASDARARILADYLAAAKQQDSNFSGFSATRGEAFYHAKHTGGKKATPSCTSCHTDNPRKAGRTRAGKTIEPVAVSVAPQRFTDAAKVEKWFRRNCKSVLGRECTPAEKGDYITYMMNQ